VPGPFDPTRPGVVEGEPVFLGVPKLRSLWRAWRERRHPAEDDAPGGPPPEDDDPTA
jgi:hypothetical protein